jgi:CDP-glucose 4,6-dehydratase
MFNNIYKGKKVLITGNSGFKGGWLTTWLLKLGADVYGISKDVPTSPSMFEELNLRNKITYFENDIRDLDSVNKIFNKIKPDFIFHMAAQPIVSESYKDPLNTISSNVIGTTNVLESLRTLNFSCTCIIITSDKCYDNIESIWGYKEDDSLGGKDIYSGSKAAAEIIFNSYFHSFFKDQKKSNVRLASVRAGNVIGGGDWALNRIVPDCINSWLKNEGVEIRNPNSTRPWQHVLEPLSGYLHLAEKLYSNIDLNGTSFNFGPSSENTKTVNELLIDLSSFWNLSVKPFYIKSEINSFHEAGLLKLNCDKALFYLKWIPTLSYYELTEFTSTWYYSFYKSSDNILDFTLNQIDKYEKAALRKKISWAYQK